MNNFTSMTAITVFVTVVGLASSMAHAQSVEYSEPTVISDIDNAVLDYIEPVCNGDFVLSERATMACNANIDAIPTMLSDGSRLSNRGVGSEFNTLIRQIPIDIAVIIE